MFLLKLIPLIVMIFSAYLIFYRQTIAKYFAIDQDLMIIAVSITFMLLSLLGFILIQFKFLLFFWIWLGFTILAFGFIIFIAYEFKKHP